MGVEKMSKLLKLEDVMQTSELLNSFEGELLNKSLFTDFTIEKIEYETRYMKLGKNRLFIDLMKSERGIIEKLKETDIFVTSQPALDYKDRFAQFIVPDTRTFLFSLAEHARRNFLGAVIGVTGSVGKTTTRMMISYMLEKAGSKVLANRGNHNSRISIPFYTSLLNLSQDYACIEIAAGGMLKNKKNGNLADYVQPDIAVITNIGEAHLERYNSTMEIAQIKSGIMDRMKPDSPVVINQDFSKTELDYIRDKAEKLGLRVITYSKNDSNADVFVKEKRSDGLVIDLAGQLIEYQLPNYSDALIENSMASLAVMSLLNLDVRQAAFDLKEFKTLKRIMKEQHLVHQEQRFILIDDTHNAAFPSMKNAIQLFASKKSEHRGTSILVLSQIAELGEESEKIHEKLVPYIIEAKPDILIGYTDKLIPVLQQVEKKGIFCQWCKNMDELCKSILANIEEDSLVLLKGSVSGSDFQQIGVEIIKTTSRMEGVTN